jgi:hypothetical protein
MKKLGLFLAVILIIGGLIGAYFWLNQEKPQKYTGPTEKATLRRTPKRQIRFFGSG